MAAIPNGFLNRIAELQGVKEPNATTRQIARAAARLDGDKDTFSQQDIRFATMAAHMTGRTDRLTLDEAQDANTAAVRNLDGNGGNFTFVDAQLRRKANNPSVSINPNTGTPEQRAVLAEALRNLESQQGYTPFNGTIHILPLAEAGAIYVTRDQNIGGTSVKQGDVVFNSNYLNSTFTDPVWTPESREQGIRSLLAHELVHASEGWAAQIDPRYEQLNDRATLHDEVIANKAGNAVLNYDRAVGKPVYFSSFLTTEDGIKQTSPALYGNFSYASGQEKQLLDEVLPLAIGRLAPYTG